MINLLNLDISRLNQNLTADHCLAANKVEWFDEINSTNDYVMAKQSVHGHVCLAGLQTAGRGRRGKPWQAPIGSSVLMSLGWEIDISQSAGLSLVIGIAVEEALSTLDISGISLKWPNDVLMNGQKLAGILIDISHNKCVIGLGLNVNIDLQETDNTMNFNKPWTALNHHGYHPDRTQLVRQLIVCVYKYLEKFTQTGFLPFINQWSERHYFHGKKVAMSGPEITNGIVIGVNELGGLLLTTKNGLKTFYAGDFSMLPVKVSQ